jgi:predicted RNA methylase
VNEPPERDVVELEVLEGLVPFVLDELDRLRATVDGLDVLDHDATAVRLRAPATARADLVAMRTVVAAYAVLTFAITRPRTLLSPEHLRRITDEVTRIRRANPKGSFTGFRISAAGSDSEDFRRLGEEIGRTTGLVHDPVDGELLVRVRRSKVDERGWDVLVRVTPRPSATRAWRVANYPGAVNATIAASMVDATHPTPGDRYLNLMCGSGTLLVERLAYGAPSEIVGVDHHAAALDATTANLRAARRKGRVDLWDADATDLAEVTDARFDVLVADLPWGTLVGSHDDNAVLYPAVLAEAARVAVPGARFVVLTHEVRLMERTLRDQQAWRRVDEVRVFQKGHHPRLIRLERV